MDNSSLKGFPDLYCLPQRLERLGFFLPRAFLRWAEIHLIPDLIPQREVDAALDFWRQHKVALVKQTAYEALYRPAKNAAWYDLALSSACHLGPLAFLSELRADYYVVRQAREPETFLWKEKFAYDPDPEVSWKRRLAGIQEFERTPAGKNLPSVDDIAWQDYDLVVAMDIPVPGRITQGCPRTLWSYFSTEAGGPLQKGSLCSPVMGYHFFLNHGFRRYRCRPRNKSHVLEFPFQFQSTANWRDLEKRICGMPASRRTILVERQSREPGHFESALPIHYMSGHDHLIDYLHHLFHASFAVQTTSKSRWGNWAVETILAGSLFLGNPHSLAHSSPLLPGLAFDSLMPALAMANDLARDPANKGEWQFCQRKIVEEFCFRRPLVELTRTALSCLK